MKSGVKGFWKKQNDVICRHASVVFPDFEIVNPFPDSEFHPFPQWEKYVRDFQVHFFCSDSDKSF